jgi:hypothetical protein
MVLVVTLSWLSAVSICDFKFTCWQDANAGKGLRTFMYANGPKHLVEVGKTPNVPEVTNAT